MRRHIKTRSDYGFSDVRLEIFFARVRTVTAFLRAQLVFLQKYRNWYRMLAGFKAPN